MESKLLKINGKNTIVVDGKPITNLSFKSFRPSKNNISDFYKAGIKVNNMIVSSIVSALAVPYSLHGETWFGEGIYDFAAFDKQMELFRENAPDTYMMVHLHVDSRKWWHEQNPGRPESFYKLSQIAPDEKWRRDTADYIKAFIKYAEDKYNDIIIGYFLLGGHTTEWFSSFDFEESHPIKLADYRRYMNDETVEIPTKDRLERPRREMFLDPVADKDVIDYRKYHHRLIADTVNYFGAAAQEVLCHKKLLGCYWGYVMELIGARVWNWGHLEGDRVYRSGIYDFYATPSSYAFRDHDESSAYMIPSDSVELNGQTYIISFDHLTHVFPTLINNERRLCSKEDFQITYDVFSRIRRDLLKNAKETRDVLRREMMQTIAKRGGEWWFDMMEGWFYDDETMADIANNVEIYKKYEHLDSSSISEVAQFVSSESLYYINKESYINSEHITFQRGAFSKLGAPYDCYSFNDIDRIDLSKYKLLVFSDAFMMTDEQREYIKSKVKGDGRSLLFVGPADYVNDSGFSIERTCDMVEMKLEAETGEKTIIAYGDDYGHAVSPNTLFKVVDDSCEAIGRFENGSVALAKVKKEDYTVYFSSLGNISTHVLREIAREAGVHIYTENDAAVFINKSFTGVYNACSDETVLDIGCNGRFTEIFSGKEYTAIDGKITLITKDDPAHMLIKSHG